MCRCTPNIRTPFCGKPGCEITVHNPDGARSTDRSITALEAFIAKWHPQAEQRGEFIQDVQRVIFVSVAEAVEYITKDGA